MPALFEYLLKANIALLLFCAGYYLVLRRLTFYSLNRVYLICAILFSAIYPLIDLTSFFEHHQLSKPVVAVQVIMVDWQAPVQAVVHQAPGIDWWSVARIVFFAGIVCMLVRLLMQLLALYRLTRKAREGVLYNYRIKAVDQDINPFSFWQSIYINPNNHEPEQLKAILAHEQVHITGWHTLDILLAEISLIVYWFNPGVWLIKRAVAENIEFITDRKILNQGVDSKAYQYSLLHVALTAGSPAIVNHFNLSKLKKRIIMMNSKASSRYNLTRYAFIIPLMAGLLCFTFSKANVAVKTKTAIKKMAAVVVHQVAPGSVADSALKVNIEKTDSAITQRIKEEITATGITQIPASNDTGRRVHLSINTTDRQHDTTNHARITDVRVNGTAADSTTIFLNGRVIKPSELSGLDPRIITEMYAIDASKVPTLITAHDSHKHVMIITTNQSPEGLQFRNSIPGLQPLSTTHPKTWITQQSFTYNNTDPDTIRVSANGGIAGKFSRSSTGKGIVIVGANDNGSKNKVPVNGTDFSNFTNSEHMLLIVDGHEVSLSILQSLNPDRIGSIAVLSNIQGKATYGAKGKNGALVVSTRMPNPTTGLKGRVDNIRLTGFTTSYNATQNSTWGNSVPVTGKYNGATVMVRTTPANRLMVIDGVPAYQLSTKSSNTVSVDPGDIENMKMIDAEQATALYGEKGRYGATLITTKHGSHGQNGDKVVRRVYSPGIDANNNLLIRSEGVLVKESTNGEPNYRYNVTTQRTQLDKAYILIDGKASTLNDYNKIDPDSIAHMQILNDSTSKAAYGTKGKNGVVIITTRKP